ERSGERSGDRSEGQRTRVHCARRHHDAGRQAVATDLVTVVPGRTASAWSMTREARPGSGIAVSTFDTWEFISHWGLANRLK
ncbi:MAG: hypothetical protein KDJ39_14955, partial [Gammaproteobacteria bacterium]|nr:hypothetical protein [Gammaproteobacteria bacterium]